MEYLTANIKYSGIEDKGLTINVIDENKKKWTVWKADRTDKTMDSEPYRALQQFKLGESFGVSYGEKEESFVGKDGKNVTYTRKTIYSILPTIKNPTQKEPIYHKEQTDKKETNWDEIAVGKCQTVFLQAFIQSGKSFSEAKLQVTAARGLAELVVYGSQQAKPEPPYTGEEPPMPDDIQEIDTSYIPF